jgi:predicted Ser/Thr protein kinase
MNQNSEFRSNSVMDEILHDLTVEQSLEDSAFNRDEFRLALAAHNGLAEMLDTNDCGIQPAEDEPQLPLNLTDRYEIRQEIGRGGMGVVYLARQKSLNRLVAIKVLRVRDRDSGQLLQRFRDEAQHLAKLRHPHIVSIHEVGEADGEPFFTMDYVDGESLSALISKGSVSPTRAVALIKQVALAIQHAHRQGIIHRDLKPANVLVDQSGHVYVSDFGLARDLRTESTLTQSNEMLGTPQYMSPEQARGQLNLVGESTDIHGLGLVLYEMLAGHPAFRAPTAADVLVKLLHDDPEPLRKLDRRIPCDLETICMKALAKKPAARYANVTAMLEDLRRFENGEALLARRTHPIVRVFKWGIQHWRIGSAMLATAVVMLLLVPRIYDKTFDELMKWGQEELQSFRAPVAAQIFQRAHTKGQGAQQELALNKLAEAIGQFDDDQDALALAKEAIRMDDRLSFGKYDLLLAQSCVQDARKKMPNKIFEPLHNQALDPALHQACELAEKRLGIFLDGPWGNAEERQEATAWLKSIRSVTVGLLSTRRGSPDELATLPEGSIQELESQQNDLQRNPWDRGRAAMAMGRKFEFEGNRHQAQRKYREAMELMRQVFPFVTGISSNQQAGVQSRNSISPQSRLMQDLLADLQRGDPSEDFYPDGGLTLSVQPSDGDEQMEMTVMLELVDPKVEDPHSGLTRSLNHHVFLDRAGSQNVGVLNGTYRLKFAGSSRSRAPLGSVAPELIEIGVDGWPEIVEISGQWIELPPIQVRKLEEIQWHWPEMYSQVSLSGLKIKWSPISGIEKYKVQIGYFVDTPHPQAFWQTLTETQEANLDIDQLTEFERQTVMAHWREGRMAGIRVDGIAEDGNRMATSRQALQFMILGDQERKLQSNKPNEPGN